MIVERQRTQALIVHLIRTPKLPVVDRRAARPWLAATGCVVIAGL